MQSSMLVTTTLGLCCLLQQPKFLVPVWGWVLFMHKNFIPVIPNPWIFISQLFILHFDADMEFKCILGIGCIPA